MGGRRTILPLWARAAGIVAAACMAGSAARATPGDNIDPAGDGHKYAWGENVGWINAKPAGDGGPGVIVSDGKLTGWMWGENIGWINLSCENEAACAVTQYGVTNDGFGALSGLAWSENAGWINFRPTTCAGDPTCGVRIDPASGYFAGRAWGENIGWITFSSAGPQEWTTRTSWCQATTSPPGTGAELHVTRPVSDPVLDWTALEGASWYDIAAGSLSLLRSTGGDFAAATSRCLVSRTAGTSFAIPASPPRPGDGIWFLVRGGNCRGRGTYDTGSPSQAAPRDPGIAASGRDCQ
jgi:hypothetical protein